MMGNWTVYVDPKMDDKTKSLLLSFKGVSILGPESYIIKKDGKTFWHYGAPKGCKCGNDHPEEKS